ncbi:MAG TPA: hypothetical protein VFG43_10525 [Geminicoccaceae bacterium]|nr:hypothetical protein [Geminicoccaceae bacterium]
MTRRTLAKLLAVLGLVGLPLVVVTCVNVPDEIPGHPGAAQQIRALYEARALERGGYCTLPRIRTITDSRVVSENADRLVLEVRYYYEPFADQDLQRGTCKDFATRTFTFARRGAGWELQGMSGAQR